MKMRPRCRAFASSVRASPHTASPASSPVGRQFAEGATVARAPRRPYRAAPPRAEPVAPAPTPHGISQGAYRPALIVAHARPIVISATW